MLLKEFAFYGLLFVSAYLAIYFYRTIPDVEVSAKASGIILIVALLSLFLAVNLGRDVSSLSPPQKQLAKSIGVDDRKFLNLLCEQKTVCAKYDAARNDCATAGNINECIEIKMGKSDYSFCGDQFFAGDNSIVPTGSQCRLGKLFNFLGGSD